MWTKIDNTQVPSKHPTTKTARRAVAAFVVLAVASVIAPLPAAPHVEAEYGIPSSGNGDVIAAMKKFSVGNFSTCVTRPDGYPVCWGLNDNNSFGVGWASSDALGESAAEMGGALRRSVPVSTSGSYYRRTSAVFAGGDQTCLLDTTQVLRCTGVAANGALGRSDGLTTASSYNFTFDDASIVNLGTGRNVIDVAPGGDSPRAGSGSPFNCALLDNGSVKCWGPNSSGQLGLGDTNNRGDQAGEMGDALPSVDLGTGVTATAVAAGFNFVCAIVGGGSVAAGSVKCWGANNTGQLGLGDTSNRGDGANEMGDALPIVNIGTGRTAKFIAAGYNSVCAIRDNDSVVCWGDNSQHQLGRDLANTSPNNVIGDSANEMGGSLVPVALGQGAVQIALGSTHACALLADFVTVKCWGSNWAGQLGQGDTNNRGSNTAPVSTLSAIDLGLNAGETISVLDSGNGHVCVYTSSSRIKCWGSNNYAQLGLGDKLSRGDASGELGSSLPAVDYAATSPTEVTALTKTSTPTSVTFSWSEPEFANGTITDYEASCGSRGTFGSAWNTTNNGWTSLAGQRTVTVTSTSYGAVAGEGLIECLIRARTIAGTNGTGMQMRIGTTAGTPLTVTASSHVVTIGDPVPTVTGTPSVNGVSRTGESCTTTYTVSSLVGTYPTVCTGGSATGYTITYVDGLVTVRDPAPAVASVNPVSGPAIGGTALTVTGTGFASGASVTVGGAACTGVTVVSATSITCATPAGAAGAADVVVTNTDTQSGTGTGVFTYVAAPTVVSVSPSSGLTVGGTLLTVTGAGFLSGASVTVGGAACTGVTVVSATSITCTTPAGAAGAADVVVTNFDTQSGTGTGVFTYVVPAPAPEAPVAPVPTTVPEAPVGAAQTPTTTVPPTTAPTPVLVTPQNQAQLEAEPGEGTAIINGAPAEVEIIKPTGGETPEQLVELANKIAEDLNKFLPKDTENPIEVVETDEGAELTGVMKNPDNPKEDIPVPVDSVTLVKAGDNTAMLVSALNQTNLPADINSGGSIEVTRGGTLSAIAYGMPSGEDGEIVLMSTPRLLTKFKVDESGTYRGQVPLPKDIEFGSHTVVMATKSAKVSLGIKLVRTRLEFRVKKRISTRLFLRRAGVKINRPVVAAAPKVTVKGSGRCKANPKQVRMAAKPGRCFITVKRAASGQEKAIFTRFTVQVVKKKAKVKTVKR